MTLTALILSGSTDGQPIKVAATAIASGTTIHTAPSSGLDEITLYATNTDTATRQVTIGWGGTTDPDSLVLKSVSLPASSGPIPIVTGLRLQNSLVVKAAADSANKVLISGVANRIA